MLKLSSILKLLSKVKFLVKGIDGVNKINSRLDFFIDKVDF